MSRAPAKVGTITFRTTGDLRERLRAASTTSGLSITQEVERRLERSFLLDDMRQIIREEVGDGSGAPADARRLRNALSGLLAAVERRWAGHDLLASDVWGDPVRAARLALYADEGGDEDERQ